MDARMWHGQIMIGKIKKKIARMSYGQIMEAFNRVGKSQDGGSWDISWNKDQNLAFPHIQREKVFNFKQMQEYFVNTHDFDLELCLSIKI